METLGMQSDLITKMPNICWILPYYDYAYESVKILRGLCKQTRDLWINQQEAIIKMLEKQTIYIDKHQPIDDKTIDALQRGNRFKLFKLEFEIRKDENKFLVLYCMLHQMPELEVAKIYILPNSEDFIEFLAQNSLFKTKQDLFKVLDWQDCKDERDLNEFADCGTPTQSEPYEYSTIVINPEVHDMECYVKHAGSIVIRTLDKDMNIDCIADKIIIDPACIQNIASYNLGTKRFFDSVRAVDIKYEHECNKSQVDEDLDNLHKHFSNLKCVNLTMHDHMSLTEVGEVLKNWKLNHCVFCGSKPSDQYLIKSNAKCLALYDCENQLFIDFENLKLQSASDKYKTQGDYVIIEYDYANIELDVKNVKESCNDYDSLNLELIDKPSIILHRKCIEKLTIDHKLKQNLDFTPTEGLEVNCDQSDVKNYNKIIEYLSTHSLENLCSQVTFAHLQGLEVTDFDNLTQSIFENLNIKVLKVLYLNHELMTSQFYEKIKNCSSLRNVDFKGIQNENADAVLDVVDANQYVKQWTIDFGFYEIYTHIKERLTKMLSDRDDNSLFVSSNRNLGSTLDGVPQITQQFRIYPV